MSVPVLGSDIYGDSLGNASAAERRDIVKVRCRGTHGMCVAVCRA